MREKSVKVRDDSVVVGLTGNSRVEKERLVVFNDVGNPEKESVELESVSESSGSSEPDGVDSESTVCSSDS